MARTGRPREFDRDNAIEQAMNLFWENGFESTSLAELRKTLGLSSASFYAAFGSKQSLYEECFRHYSQTCGEFISELKNQDVCAKQALKNMLHKTISVQTSKTSPSGCMAVLSGLNCGEENKAVEELTRHARQKSYQALKECVKRAVDEGELPATTNIDTFTMAIDTFIKGISIQARDGASAQALHAASEHILSLWDQ